MGVCLHLSRSCVTSTEVKVIFKKLTGSLCEDSSGFAELSPVDESGLGGRNDS